MQLKTQLQVVFGGVFILLVLLHHFTAPNQTTGADPQSKTSLRSSGGTPTTASSQATNGTPNQPNHLKEIRISSVWVVRETPSTLEVLLVPRQVNRTTVLYQLPFETSNDFDIPKKAAAHVLLRLGLQEQHVETFHSIRHGEFRATATHEEFHDATSYVAVVGLDASNSGTLLMNTLNKLATSYAGKSNPHLWLPISKIHDLVVGRSRSGVNPWVLSSIVQDDYASAREFLEPFVLTTGKNPVQCLGAPPPGWIRPKDRVWPTERAPVV